MLLQPSIRTLTCSPHLSSPLQLLRLVHSLL